MNQSMLLIFLPFQAESSQPIHSRTGWPVQGTSHQELVGVLLCRQRRPKCWLWLRLCDCWWCRSSLFASVTTAFIATTTASTVYTIVACSKCLILCNPRREYFFNGSSAGHPNCIGGVGNGGAICFGGCAIGTPAAAARAIIFLHNFECIHGLRSPRSHVWICR